MIFYMVCSNKLDELNNIVKNKFYTKNQSNLRYITLYNNSKVVELRDSKVSERDPIIIPRDDMTISGVRKIGYNYFMQAGTRVDYIISVDSDDSWECPTEKSINGDVCVPSSYSLKYADDKVIPGDDFSNCEDIYKAFKDKGAGFNHLVAMSYNAINFVLPYLKDDMGLYDDPLVFSLAAYYANTVSHIGVHDGTYTYNRMSDGLTKRLNTFNADELHKRFDDLRYYYNCLNEYDSEYAMNAYKYGIKYLLKKSLGLFVGD